MLANYLMVAFGGAFGALTRYQVGLWFQANQSSNFPFATLTVNVLGSFLFGVAFYFIVEKASFEDSMRLLVMVGFLGALTTFSTFSFEILSLLQKGEWTFALLNIVANVVLSLLALCFAYFSLNTLKL